MRGKASSRRGILGTAIGTWRRALPLLAATMMALPGGVAFAAPPSSQATNLVAQAAITGTVQIESERRCFFRCNEPEKPKPGARLQQAAEKARTTVQEAREDVREATQDVREDAREVVGEVREATGKARAAVGEVKEAAGEIKEAGSAREAVAEAREGVGEVRDALTDPAPTTEAANNQQAAQAAPPSEPVAPIAHAEPAPATAPASSMTSSPAAAGQPATTGAGPSTVAPVPSVAIQPESSAQTAVRRPDGVAGGPNASATRPEPGTLGQGKSTDAAAPQAPAPAVAGPALDAAPEGPIVAQAPPVAPVVAAPPAVAPPSSSPADRSDDATVASASTDDSEMKLEQWSAPLAVAGAVLAGVALALPMARRRPPALAQAPNHHALSYRAPTGPAAHGAAHVSHPGFVSQPGLVGYPEDQTHTYPGASQVQNPGPTLLTRPVRAATSHTIRPVRDSLHTAPNVRLNGAPVPYLRPVASRSGEETSSGQPAAGGTRPGFATDVSGLAWSDSASNDRSKRALA